jgi:hypothetical protein
MWNPAIDIFRWRGFTFLLIIFSVLFAGYSADLTTLGTGARPLGMGNTGVALMHDLNSLSGNPAGLGLLVTPCIQLFSSRIVSDVDYIALTGAYPVSNNGVVAGGLLRASVSGIPITELDEDFRPVVVQEVTYSDSVYVLSWGQKYMEKLYIGISAKYFSKGVSGYGWGKGVNADIGLLYQYNEQWDFGLVQKNGIPLMGGVGGVAWDTGATDPVAASLIPGVVYRQSPQWLIATDVDMSQRKDRKGLIHFGTEYAINAQSFVRAGWQQLEDLVGYTTDSTISLGFGLRLNDLQFDYAYQQLQDIKYSTHFVSVQYNFNQ